ncbi:transporter substrate-binding domain-containing protein [uncultured Muribaculum sp.]|uniref:transporter substrate-binding domain-containing protein n=1 Tax=uncultured Muribaculum sp. TaxID=1918613 RepID=UPI0025EDFFE8|nr:transporter substrate-binding domain-containing protein [uncultured Muribaculum sp.]
MELMPKKGNGLLYATLLLFVLLGMYGLRRCADAKNPVGVGGIVPSGGDTIDVAIEYAPLVCYTYADTLGGVHYDMLREIASSHGVAIKFHPVTSFDRSLALLDDSVIDMLVADVPMTAEFRGRYRFLEPVLVDRQVLVQLRDSVSGHGPVRSALDLGGDTVWIAAGSSVESRIRNLGREIGDTIYIIPEKEYGPEQLAIMTATGEIPRAVISRRIAGEIAKDYPRLDVVTEVSFNQFQSWITGRHSDIAADSLDIWINRYKATDAYRALLERYRMK